MKRSQPTLYAAGLALLTLFAHADSGGNLADWSGTWSDEPNEGIMLVTRTSHFLDIVGKDGGSRYSAACLVRPDQTARCHGDGLTINDERFLYTSTLSLQNAGQISETWQAFFFDGEKEATKEGSARFTKPTLSAK